MSEIERVEKVRSFLGFNKGEFSKKLKYSTPQSYTNYLTGNSNLSLRALKALKKYDSRISLDWILTGQGNMLNGELNGTGDENSISKKDKSSKKELESKIALLEQEVEHLKVRLKDKEAIIELLRK